MSTNLRLHGKIALVTGGGRGIGKAITRRFAEAGASVAIASRKLENLEATAREFASLPGKVLPLACHVGHKEQIEHLVRETETRLGPVDILVNNSATTIGQGQALAVTDEMLDKIVEINIKAALRLVRLIVPKMIERKSGGAIINIASVLSFQGGVRVPAYAAAKGALAQLTKALANEWAGKGVNVNAIAPGYMRTDNTRALADDSVRYRQILDRIPAGRWGEPDDLGGAAVFLASRASDYVHGHVLVVDGGWMGR